MQFLRVTFSPFIICLLSFPTFTNKCCATGATCADKDRQNNKVLRPFEGTDQVDRQRSLILTHDNLMKQIRRKAQIGENEKHEKARLDAAKINSILERVDEIETDLVSRLPSRSTGAVVGNSIPTRRKMAEVANKCLGRIADLPHGSTFVWSEEILEYLKNKDRGGFKTLEEKLFGSTCLSF